MYTDLLALHRILPHHDQVAKGDSPPRNGHARHNTQDPSQPGPSRHFGADSSRFVSAGGSSEPQLLHALDRAHERDAATNVKPPEQRDLKAAMRLGVLKTFSLVNWSDELARHEQAEEGYDHGRVLALFERFFANIKHINKRAKNAEPLIHQYFLGIGHYLDAAKTSEERLHLFATLEPTYKHWPRQFTEQFAGMLFDKMSKIDADLPDTHFKQRRWRPQLGLYLQTQRSYNTRMHMEEQARLQAADNVGPQSEAERLAQLKGKAKVSVYRDDTARLLDRVYSAHLKDTIPLVSVKFTERAEHYLRSIGVPVTDETRSRLHADITEFHLFGHHLQHVRKREIPRQQLFNHFNQLPPNATHTAADAVFKNYSDFHANNEFADEHPQRLLIDTLRHLHDMARLFKREHRSYVRETSAHIQIMMGLTRT